MTLTSLAAPVAASGHGAEESVDFEVGGWTVESRSPARATRCRFSLPRGSRTVDGQICTRVPSSTTQLCGSLKKSATLPALRDIVANSDSRQCAMPDPGVGTTISRLRK